MKPSRTYGLGLEVFWMTSGSKPSILSIPKPDNTSDRPCAAPCRSTPLVSDRRVCMSCCTRSGKFVSPSLSTRVPRDLAAVARASGTGSTRTSWTRGISSARYGIRSRDSVNEALTWDELGWHSAEGPTYSRQSAQRDAWCLNSFA
jgi:hypothetical protein